MPGGTWPAKDLYQSPLFKKARAYVQRSRSDWYILSAKHDLLDPAATLKPYDLALTDLDRHERSLWAERVIAKLAWKYPDRARTTFIMLAGRTYRHDLVPILRQLGYKVKIPLRGKSIGEQLRWFNNKLKRKRR
jgi:hypothetical protein